VELIVFQSMFLDADRNMSKRGIVLVGKKQCVTFVDPKGIRRLEAPEDSLLQDCQGDRDPAGRPSRDPELVYHL
jgi:hypothetical protein